MKPESIQFIFYILAAMLSLALSFFAIHCGFYWGFFAGFQVWAFVLLALAISSETSKERVEA